MKLSIQNQLEIPKFNTIPQHIAIIMDGNGRWAKQRGNMRIFGHRNAIEAVRQSVEGCAELGVKFLTLYTFSTENWNRPKDEIDALMELLVSAIKEEVPTLMKNNIKLNAIGDLESLPEKAQKQLLDSIEKTKENAHMTLTLALSYSGRWDITCAVKEIAKKVKSGEIEPEEINESKISEFLRTFNIPDPELMIRTSGEMRISNFLLWQLAYSELYISDVLWPDFRKNHLYEAITNFNSRERRFGKTSEQVFNQA
ncbi:MAG: isoprenyl transferase [Cytophagales bacterium]